MKEIILFTDIKQTKYDHQFMSLYSYYKNYYMCEYKSIGIIVTKSRDEVLKNKLKMTSEEYEKYLLLNLLYVLDDITIEDRINPYLIKMFKKMGNEISLVEEGRFFKITVDNEVEKIVFPENDGYTMI